MKRRVTQADVARAAGVHSTTVSLALRDNPLIQETTRERIRAIATDLGYTPDPAGRALASYRFGVVQAPQLATLAYVLNAEDEDVWRNDPMQCRVHAGVQRKAAEHGMHVEHFWLGDSGMSWPEFDREVKLRSIRLVLLAGSPPNRAEADSFDWSRVCAVRMGEAVSHLGMHRLDDNAEAALRIAVERASAFGYGRIGFALPLPGSRHATETWESAIWAAHFRLSSNQRVPVFSLPAGQCDRSPEAATGDGLADWVIRYKPDVVFACGRGFCEELTESGVSIPDEVAYVDLCCDGSGASIAGVRPNCERRGEIAVELLNSQLQLNEFGPQRQPLATLVDGTWEDGETLPLNAASRRPDTAFELTFPTRT